MVPGRGFLSKKKTASTQSTEKRLRFDITLFELVRAAGCSIVCSPENVVQLFCDVASSLSSAACLSDREKNTEPDAVVLILDAIERVLEGYAELVVSPATDGREVPGSYLTSASLANLRSIAISFLQRPALPSPLLAAFFQLTILVVKHAPLEVLDAEGCSVLVSLLELLRCLPRSTVVDDGPGIQQIARITGRNVMRRVCPRIFLQDIHVHSDSLRQGKTAAARGAAVSEQVDRHLLPWLERQLLPLNVVSGEKAQADLKEDRRLALSLLDYLCLGDNVNKFLTNSRRIAILYIADAVASLLEEDEEFGGNDSNERQLALSFLERAKNVLSSEAVSALPSMSACNSYGEPHPKKVMILNQDAQEFLLLKDAEYVKEFSVLHQRIEEERGNHDILQWQLEELARNREEVLKELQDTLFDSRVPYEEIVPSCTLPKENLSPGTDKKLTPSTTACAWNVESFLEPLERLAVLLHDTDEGETFSSRADEK